jgi:hypothetical protein
MFSALLLSVAAAVVAWFGESMDALLWLGICTMCLEKRPGIWLLAYGVALSSSEPATIFKIVAVAIIVGLGITQHNLKT